MFLKNLDTDSKNKFMQLICLAANIDKNCSNEELSIIHNYQNELGIPVLPKIRSSASELIAYFSKFPESVRKMIYFEIYGLIRSDNLITTDENDLLHDIEKNFGLGSDITQQIKMLAKKLQDVYSELFSVLS